MGKLALARTALLVAFVCASSACSKDTPEDILAVGKGRLERKDYNGARLNFKTVLQKDPQQAQARLLLANVDVTLGFGAEAEEEFNKAIELGVTRDSVLVQLTRARLLSGDYAKIIEEAKATGEGSGGRSNKENAELQALRGHAYYLSGDTTAAKAAYESALKLAADDVEARFGLIRLSATASSIPAAKKELAEFLKSEPGFAAGWGLLADWESIANQPEAAVDAYTKAIDASPNNYGYRLGRLYVWAANNKCDLVTKELPGFGDKKNRDPRVSFIDGLCKLSAGKLNEARESLLAALALTPDYAPAQLALGNVNIQLKQYEQADEALNVARRNPSLRIKAVKMLAYSHLARGDLPGAKAVLLELSGETPDDPEAATLLGKFALAEGKEQEGVDYFQKAVTQQPASAEAFLNLGVAFQQSGAAGKSREALEKALSLNPALKQASYQLVTQAIAAKKFDEASAQVRQLQQQDAKDPVPYNLEGLIALEQSRIPEARAAFRHALDLSPSYVAAALNLANLEITQKNIDEADKVLSAATKGAQVDPIASMRLAEIKVMAGHPDEAITILRSVVASTPREVPARVVLARLLVETGKFGEALSVAHEAEGLEPKNPAVLTELGKAALLDGKRDEALTTFEKLVAVAPESALSHYLLADAYAGKSWDKAKTELQAALRIDPKFVMAKLALTKLLVATNDLKAAADMLAELEKQAPDSPDVLLVRGEIALRKGDYAGAEGAYADAIKRYPKLNQAVIGMSRAKWVEGKREQALEPLQSWLKDSPNDAVVLSRLGDVYAELGNRSKAIETFELLLKLSPDNPGVLNRLAWQLRDQSTDKAFEYAQRAASLAPGDPAIADTYGYLLTRKGKTELALNMLKKAVEQIPGEPTVRYHLALAYGAAGERQAALKELSVALKSDRPFPEKAAAQKFQADLSGTK